MLYRKFFWLLLKNWYNEHGLMLIMRPRSSQVVNFFCYNSQSKPFCTCQSFEYFQLFLNLRLSMLLKLSNKQRIVTKFIFTRMWNWGFSSMRTLPINQYFNQSIKQSTNQSVSQSISQTKSLLVFWNLSPTSGMETLSRNSWN